MCCSEENYGSNPSVYWNDKTGICCKNSFTEVQNRTDGAPEKVCCDHDVYGTSAEAYASGTCCANYEKFYDSYSNEEIHACCKGIGETPYCTPNSDECNSYTCCPSGTSWKLDYCGIRVADECFAEDYSLAECLTITHGEKGTVDQFKDTCTCPDGYKPLYMFENLVSNCCEN